MSGDFYELPILYGCDSAGVSWHIDDVVCGLDCDCFCPSCGQPLIAKNQGEKRIHHFAHRGGQCKWGVESVATMLAMQAIEKRQAMYFPTLWYFDAVDRRRKMVSDALKLRVTSVREVDVTKRKAPALLVTCRGGEKEMTFAVVVALSHTLKDTQADELCGMSDGVVLVDLKADFDYERDVQGRHFNRDELAERYQDPEYIEYVMVDGEDYITSWVRNKTCDDLERASRARAEEDRRKREEEALVRRQQEEERRRREEVERQRQTALEEEYRKERASKEACEGALRVSYRPVAKFLDYDIDHWPVDDRAARELSSDSRFAVNGQLRALVTYRNDGTRRAVLTTELGIDSVTEVGRKLDVLMDGFDDFEFHASTKNLEASGSVVVESDIDGTIVLKLNGLFARDLALALQWIRHRVSVTLSLGSRRSGKVDLADVEARTITLVNRR